MSMDSLKHFLSMRLTFPCSTFAASPILSSLFLSTPLLLLGRGDMQTSPLLILTILSSYEACQALCSMLYDRAPRAPGALVLP